ncbi:MAG: hypothetical protein OEL82_11835 [Nitrosopumilus sp.]|nr:hypothetical protein [Nitrosopumilus sp.]
MVTIVLAYHLHTSHVNSDDGSIDYIVSRRSNVTMISIPTQEYLVLISAQRDANAQEIIMHVNSAFTTLPDIKP